MTQKVYKVVRELTDGIYLSVIDTPYVIKYYLNDWATPTLKNSKIFCFKSIYPAASFLRAEGYLEYNKLFEAEVDDCYECTQDISVFGNIESYWNNGHAVKMPAPWGTYFTDRIKLIKEIPRDEWINK